MYTVSDEYLNTIQESSRNFYWSGLIKTKNEKEYAFDNNSIVKGSGYILRQCSGTSEIELGSVYSAELGFSLFSEIDRYTLDDAIVYINFHLVLPNGTLETVPMGVFYIVEANRHVKTIEIKAYDTMLNLEKNFNKGLSSASAYEFLTLLAKACHVELAQTQEEIERLPNGTELFGIYQENDIETWRDFLHYLAQALGCFAVIDRSGKLRLQGYGNTESQVVDSRHRFSSSFSDFVIRYTAISSTNKKTETAEYYAKDPDDGLTMNLGINPLLQFGLDETRKRIINNLLEVVSSVEYVPFESDTIGNPALDLGDVLKFTGGQADETKHSAITSINTKINGKQTIKCVGKNPRLAEAKSRNDKNITGLINSISENRLSIYTYTNALELELGEEKLSIINMEFASGDETNAQFHGEAIIDITSSPITHSLKVETVLDLGDSTDEEGNTVENKHIISFPLSFEEKGSAEIVVQYMLDGHEIEEYHPVETWESGNHLLNLYYPILELEANQLHTFEVLLSITNGTAKIAAQNVMATITGQGLGVQERWDGRITASEELIPFVMTAMPMKKLKETVTTNLVKPTPCGISDSFGKITLVGMPLFGFTDMLSLFTPIVHDVVEIQDKKKMVYDKTFVLDDDIFTLRKAYAIEGGVESRLNRGRMDKLTIPTANFDSLTTIHILPFDTQPFVNMRVIRAKSIEVTQFSKLEDDAVSLKTETKRLLYGEDMEIERGRLAVFSLRLEEMETLENLEVTYG